MINTAPPNTVAILNSGNSAIVVDDGCYCIRNFDGTAWGWSPWIFPEALETIKNLPSNPREAERIG